MIGRFSSISIRLALSKQGMDTDDHRPHNVLRHDMKLEQTSLCSIIPSACF
jgi:hypothetical protein